MILLFTRHSNRHRLAPMRVSIALRCKNTECGVPFQRRIRRDCYCTAVMFELIAKQTGLINQLNSRVKTQIPIAVT